MFGRFSLTDILWNLAVIIPALTVHEFSHGAAAYLLGDRTAKYDGRLSLNPIRHIDWVGLIAMVLFGFGWAKPVMVNPGRFKNPKTDMALTAAAGPVANIVFSIILIFLWMPMSIFTSGTGASGWITEFLFRCISINLGLGFFNLIPIPPLDGSKIFGVFLPENLYFRFTQMGQFGMILLIVLLYMGFINDIIYPLINMTFTGIRGAAFNLYT
ncbi:MAG: site-2 protease family protein [Clostridiales bacterium]|jgi:Zn-dependent protease|nr:site-2 protease family protein [Clostridiales bacterium]